MHEISTELKTANGYFSAESWHEYFKQRFLGVEEVKLPNGKTHLIANSSADLDQEEFGEYMSQVEVWANEHGVFLPE